MFALLRLLQIHQHHNMTTIQQQQTSKTPRLTIWSYLRNIMRHIINHMHVEIIGFSVELLRKGLAHEEGHAGTVDPSIVGGRSHAGEVILSFLYWKVRKWEENTVSIETKQTKWHKKEAELWGRRSRRTTRTTTYTHLNEIDSADRYILSNSKHEQHTGELMRAQASCRSLVTNLSRVIAASMAVKASVATWWPSPRDPLCIIMHTWPAQSIWRKRETEKRLNVHN